MPVRPLTVLRTTLVGVTAALTVLVPAAHATLYGRQAVNYAETVPDSICGLDVTRTSTYHGSVALRTGENKDDTAFFQRVTLRENDVFTYAPTGRSITISSTSNLIEVKATRVFDNVFEFTSVEAGQPFVLSDDAGHVILRDRGVIRRVQLFDTLGDAQPGGISIDEQILNVAGPHPGFDMSDGQFCSTVTGLLGA